MLASASKGVSSRLMSAEAAGFVETGDLFLAELIQRLLRKAGEPQGVRSGHFKSDDFMYVRLSPVRVLTRVYQIPVPAAPGLDSETWDPSNSPQPSLAPAHDSSRTINPTPTQKPVILSAAQRSRKICGCLFILFSKPINRTHPSLASGHDPSRTNNPTPTQKPVILSAAQRSRKICGCFLSPSASQSTARNPALCQGTTSVVPKNAASTYAGFSPCVPTLGNFRLAGHSLAMRG